MPWMRQPLAAIGVGDGPAREDRRSSRVFNRPCHVPVWLIQLGCYRLDPGRIWKPCWSKMQEIFHAWILQRSWRRRRWWTSLQWPRKRWWLRAPSLQWERKSSAVGAANIEGCQGEGKPQEDGVRSHSGTAPEPCTSVEACDRDGQCRDAHAELLGRGGESFDHRRLSDAASTMNSNVKPPTPKKTNYMHAEIDLGNYVKGGFAFVCHDLIWFGRGCHIQMQGWTTCLHSGSAWRPGWHQDRRWHVLFCILCEWQFERAVTDWFWGNAQQDPGQRPMAFWSLDHVGDVYSPPRVTEEAHLQGLKGQIALGMTKRPGFPSSWASEESPSLDSQKTSCSAFALIPARPSLLCGAWPMANETIIKCAWKNLKVSNTWISVCRWQKFRWKRAGASFWSNQPLRRRGRDPKYASLLKILMFTWCEPTCASLGSVRNAALIKVNLVESQPSWPPTLEIAAHAHKVCQKNHHHGQLIGGASMQQFLPQLLSKPLWAALKRWESRHTSNTLTISNKPSCLKRIWGTTRKSLLEIAWKWMLNSQRPMDFTLTLDFAVRRAKHPISRWTFAARWTSKCCAAETHLTGFISTWSLL